MTTGGYPRPHPGQHTPPPQPRAASAADPLADKLRNLKAAFEAEIIAQDEYNQKKAALLADF